jgi:hypothetical protein
LTRVNPDIAGLPNSSSFSAAIFEQSLPQYQENLPNGIFGTYTLNDSFRKAANETRYILTQLDEGLQ